MEQEFEGFAKAGARLSYIMEQIFGNMSMVATHIVQEICQTRIQLVIYFIQRESGYRHINKRITYVILVYKCKE